MSQVDVINEFLKYSATLDFRNNVYSNVAAMVLEFCLILILLPLLLWAFKLSKRRRANSMAGFYSMQFLREAALLLLRAGGVPDWKASIKTESETTGGYTSHDVYGNTPFLLDLLKRRMTEGQHVEGHLKLTGPEIAILREKSQTLLNTADQYSFLFASIDQQDYCEKFYEIRLMLYALRDYFDRLQPPAEGAFFLTDDIRGMSVALARFVHQWFSSEKKRVDRKFSRERNIQLSIFVVKLLPVLLYRIFGRRICRICNRPFSDPVADRVFPRLLVAVLESSSPPESQVCKDINVTPEELLSYRMDYRRPPFEEQVEILRKISLFVAEPVWANLVISTVVSDLDRRRPGVVEVDSTKATAVMWLAHLLSKERLQEPAIYDLQMKFVFMKPQR